MKLLNTAIMLAIATCFLVACGKESQVGFRSPIKKEDKFLSCDEIALELNDAQFYRDLAEKNKGLNVRNVVWPVGYPYTYASAEQAIELSNQRIQYLNGIYQIKHCDEEYHRPRQ